MFGRLFYLRVLPPSEDGTLGCYSMIYVLRPENVSPTPRAVSGAKEVRKQEADINR